MNYFCTNLIDLVSAFRGHWNWPTVHTVGKPASACVPNMVLNPRPGQRQRWEAGE